MNISDIPLNLPIWDMSYAEKSCIATELGWAPTMTGDPWVFLARHIGKVLPGAIVHLVTVDMILKQPQGEDTEPQRATAEPAWRWITTDATGSTALSTQLFNLDPQEVNALCLHIDPRYDGSYPYNRILNVTGFDGSRTVGDVLERYRRGDPSKVNFTNGRADPELSRPLGEMLADALKGEPIDVVYGNSPPPISHETAERAAKAYEQQAASDVWAKPMPSEFKTAEETKERQDEAERASKLSLAAAHGILSDCGDAIYSGPVEWVESATWDQLHAVCKNIVEAMQSQTIPAPPELNPDWVARNELRNTQDRRMKILKMVFDGDWPMEAVDDLVRTCETMHQWVESGAEVPF